MTLTARTLFLLVGHHGVIVVDAVPRARKWLNPDQRSVFQNPDKSAGCVAECATVCAATPVEVSLWHEKLARSLGVDGALGWCVVYSTGHDPETKKRKYLNQTSHGGLRDDQAHVNKMVGERDRG